jgi:DNA-binding transcriptional regulator YdaS (Cro superfamily)
MTPVDKLKAIINGRFENNQAAFARAINRSPSQVNQWLSGYRKLDVKACRLIEQALSLPTDHFLGPQAQKDRSEYSSSPTLTLAHELVNSLDDVGLDKAVSYLQFLAIEHPAVKAKRA